MSTINAGWRGPNIVKEGLVFYLDAGSNNSYYATTSNTTWRDISGNENNGTLINGPTFSNDAGGTIVFDGIDDYVNKTTSQSLNMSYNITILVWFKIPQNGLPYRQCLVGKHYTEYELGIYPGGYIHTYTSSGPLSCGSYDEGMNSYKPGGDWAANTWYHVGWTLDNRLETSYFNGALGSTYTKNNSGTCPTNGYNLNIGMRSSAGGLVFKGSIPIVQIYKRTLSAQEVLQNYNAQKSRFNL
jgi:hypothetical protein